MSFLTIVRDLLRYNVQFAIGAILTLVIVDRIAALSAFSPYNPLDTYVVRARCAALVGTIRSARPRAARTPSGS